MKISPYQLSNCSASKWSSTPGCPPQPGAPSSHPPQAITDFSLHNLFAAINFMRLMQNWGLKEEVFKGSVDSGLDRSGSKPRNWARAEIGSPRWQARVARKGPKNCHLGLSNHMISLILPNVLLTPGLVSSPS